MLQFLFISYRAVLSLVMVLNAFVDCVQLVLLLFLDVVVCSEVRSKAHLVLSLVFLEVLFLDFLLSSLWYSWFQIRMFLNFVMSSCGMR
jgi:hypothetical protein